MLTMQCNTKGCGSQPAYIDPKTEKVYCSKCDVEITNATHFTKVQLKTLKQYREKKSQSFSVKCPACNVEERPVQNNGKFCCSVCKKELNLTNTFKAMLKQFLPVTDKDI